MAEQRGATGAGEADVERDGLGDMGFCRARPAHRSGGQRADRIVESAAVQGAGHGARGGARHQLPALDRAESVAVQHADDPHTGGRPFAQCGTKVP